MTKLPCALLVAGLWVGTAGSTVFAQDGRQRVPPSGDSGEPSEGSAQPRQAVPRGEGPQANPRVERVERADEPAPRSVPPSARQPVAERQPPPSPRSVDPAPAPVPAAPVAEQARPRGGRGRGDNPQTGRAVPRPPGDRVDRDGRDRDRDRDGRGGGVYLPPRTTHNNYYYYPRRYYPYGYGAFGLGYFYYDPYAWSSYGYYPGQPYGYYPGRPHDYYDRGYQYGIGHLRLDVSPKHAEVFVDGYYAGIVDDFDGMFQTLDLESDGYRIEVRAPGYETLGFDVRIQPGRKITYRGTLRRLP